MFTRASANLVLKKNNTICDIFGMDGADYYLKNNSKYISVTRAVKAFSK